MVKICFFGTDRFVDPVREVLENNFELADDVKMSDLIVVASYGKILSKEILNTPKYGAINIHPSDLPKYRGPSPIQTQILDGVRESKVTFIKMDEKVDHGPVLYKVPFKISDDDTFQSAVTRAFGVGAENILHVIQRYVNNQIELVVQDDSKATFTKILTKKDGFIDFNDPPDVQKINNMTKAFYPWPGVWFKAKLNEKEQTIKLLPGEKVQVEGKNPMSYKDFINGYEKGREVLQKLGL